MFDRIVVAPRESRTEYVTREVNEHRAPTDVSVRLLAEFEEKAKQKIIKTIRVTDTAIPCTLVVHCDPSIMQTTALSVLSINGHKLDITTPLEGNFQENIEALVKDIADRLAREIIGPAFAKIADEQERRALGWRP